MKTDLTSLPEIVKSIFRVLTFRATETEMASWGKAHLAFGLLCAWLAGMGRSWDDAGASLLRKSGIGSIGYVLALSLLLYLIVDPLSESRTRYRHILTFVCFTAPLGMLYAIPVELFTPRETALQINIWFLTIVAAWRVSLLAFYFRRALALSWGEVVLSTLLPLAIIMAPLTILKAANNFFSVMGGLRDNAATDPMTNILGFLGTVSVWALIPLVAWHQIAIRNVNQKNWWL